MGFFHCCRQQTPQQRHVKLSKFVLLVCTAFLVHVVTVHHMKHRGPHDMKHQRDDMTLEMPMDEPPMREHNHKGMRPQEATTNDVAFDEEIDIVVVGGDEPLEPGQLKSDNNAQNADSAFQPKPLPHPPLLKCAKHRAAELALLAGVIAGFTGRSTPAKVWLTMLCLSCAVSLAAVILHAATVDCGSATTLNCHEHLRHSVGKFCGKFALHLLAIIVAVRLIALSKCVEEAEEVVLISPVVEEVPCKTIEV